MVAVSMLAWWACGAHCLPSFGPDQQRVLVSLLPVCVQGRPVYIQLLGKIDIHTLKQITTEERMIKFHIQEYERCGKVIMPICSRLAGRQIDQTFGIMDVKGEGAAWCQDGWQAASGSAPAYAAAWSGVESSKSHKASSGAKVVPASICAAWSSAAHNHTAACPLQSVLCACLCAMCMTVCSAVCLSADQVWGSATCLVR